MLSRNLLTVVLLGAAALSSWWLYQQVQPVTTVHTTRATHDPDYFFEDFVMTSMDAEGQPRHKLKGTRMVHYPDDDTTEVDDPELQIYSDNTPSWKIIAAHGWISPSGEEVRLDGGVQIEYFGQDNSDTIHATAEAMLIKPNEEFAETSKQVTIRSKNMQLQAVGMRAYLGEGRVELLSRVKGTHDPN